MSHRRHRESDAVGWQLQELLDDDALLTSLSRREDPSGGADPLAALLLDWKASTDQPMPKAPTAASLLGRAGLEEFRRSTGSAAVTRAVSGADRGVVRQDGSLAEGGPAAVPGTAKEAAAARVVPLRRRPWAAALVGAAAATLLIAGTGVSVYNAGPDSPLYGLNQRVFGGPDLAVVELASTLEEANKRNAEGDVKGAQEKLEQAQAMLEKLKAKDRKTGQDMLDRARTTMTTTQTTTVPAPAVVAPAQTVTVTSTVTAEPQAPTSAPRSGEPTTPTDTPTLEPRAFDGTDEETPGEANRKPGVDLGGGLESLLNNKKQQQREGAGRLKSKNLSSQPDQQEGAEPTADEHATADQ